MNAYHRTAARIRLPLLLTAFICGLSACSRGPDDPNAWYNFTMVENLTGGRNSPAVVDAAAPVSLGAVPSSALPAQQAMVAPPGLRPVSTADNELYRSEVSCGGSPPGAGGPTAHAVASIALEMTECDVARRVGPPDKIELASGLQGERVLNMTYSRSDRPRVYRFAGGRLVSIEILPHYQSPSTRRR